MKDEEVVRASWNNVATLFDKNIGKWIFFTDNDLYRLFFAETLSELWAKGRAFTEQRQREIAEIEEEIEVVSYKLPCPDLYIEVVDRILARLQSQLGELKKGWRG